MVNFNKKELKSIAILLKHRKNDSPDKYTKINKEDEWTKNLMNNMFVGIFKQCTEYFP